MRSQTKTAMVVVCAVMIVSVACVLPLNDEGDTVVQIEESDAVPPVVMYAAAALIVYLAGWMSHAALAADDHQEINDAEHAQEYIAGIFGTLAVSSVNVGELIGFTQSYFSRLGEIAAAESWSAGAALDHDRILDASSAVSAYGALLLTQYGSLDSVVDYVSKIGSSWKCGSTTYTAIDPTTSFGLGTTVTSDASDRVYIYSYSPGDETSGHLHVHGGSATIKSATGQTFVLAEGDNDLRAMSIPNGYYELQTGRTYVGSMLRSLAADKAVLTPAVVLHGSAHPICALEVVPGTYIIHGDGEPYSTTSVRCTIRDHDSTRSASLDPAFDAIRNLYFASSRLLSDTVNAASAAWAVFNAAGESSIFVSPSALIPNLDNMDFTADQIHLIYMASLQQMADYFTTASGNFTADDIMISAESLDLICHGVIYSDSTRSTVIASGHFTPICYLRDQAITVGNTAWIQPGLAMMWTENADGYTAASLTVLESGCCLSVSSMEFKGEQYLTLGDSITLSVHTLTALDGFDNGDMTNTNKTDANAWIGIVMIVIGIITILAGLLIRRVDVVLVGVAILAARYLVGGWL